MKREVDGTFSFRKFNFEFKLAFLMKLLLKIDFTFYFLFAQLRQQHKISLNFTAEL
jgi:hypothetical protein